MRIPRLKYSMQVLFTVSTSILNIATLVPHPLPLDTTPASPPSYLPGPELRAPEPGPTDCTLCPPLCSLAQQCPQ